MSSGVPAGIAMAMAITALTAYAGGWLGFALAPWTAVASGAIGGFASALALARQPDEGRAPMVAWAVVAGAIVAALVWITWPELLPPGGASDLTHHLMLVDVIERTGRLADGAQLDAALESTLSEISAPDPEARIAERYKKFRTMGRLGADFLDEAT